MVRIAALFCGLIAGLLALVAPVGLGSDLLASFLKLWGATPGQQLLGTVAWYAPVGAAVLGGLLAFVAPGLGALLLLGAGLGWAGTGLFDGAFFRLELLVPAGLSLMGALLAFVAGELELRRRRIARRNRRDMLRNSAERADDEARAREAALNMDPLTVPREEAPPPPSREIPLTLEDVVPVEAAEPSRRAETIWPESPGRRTMFERDEAELTPRRSLFDRPATRMERPAPERRERERDYYDDEPRPRRNLLGWLVGANALALIVLGVAVGYMMVEREPAPPSAGVVAEATDNAAVAAVREPAATPVAAPAAAEAVAGDDRLTPNVWPALAQPGTALEQLPVLPMATVDAPMAATVGPAAATMAEAQAPGATVATPVAGTFDDPFAYCNAVKTIDYIDNRYTGPRFTADIAEALRVPLQSAPDRVSWRCVDGVIYACASFDWPACAMTPTAQEMVDYCQRNPGSTRLLAPNGTWSCEGNRPRLPGGASWPVDARGFFPNAWIPVLPPQRPAG